MAQADQQPVPEESLLMYHAGALSEADRSVFAEWIDGNPEARATLAEWRRQDATIASLYAPIADEALPSGYREMFDAARASPARPPMVMPRVGILAAALAFLVFGAAAGWGIHELFLPRDLALSVAAARAFQTFGTETAHPVEVPATDARHLTDWISSRLGETVRPPDFSRLGFTLMGGRILPTANGPAALFLYQDADGQRIGLYVATKGQLGSTDTRYFDTEGVQGYWWLDRGVAYALAGNQPRETLRHIASMAFDQLM